eukprot:2251252-Rhodomonas_salina.1
MHASGRFKPNIISYNAVMQTCGRAALAPAETSADWIDKMLAVKERMQADRVVPDVRSYTTLIVGISKGLARIAEEG